MLIGVKLVLVTILILGISGKFSEEPSYSFQIWNATTTDMLVTIQLAPDDDMLVTFSLSANYYKYHQTIYNFDGSVVCDQIYPYDVGYLGWPSQTNAVFYNPNNKSLSKATTLCGAPTYLADVPVDIAGIAFGHNSKESYIGFSFKTNELIEYNLENGATNQYSIDSTQKLDRINYSPDRDFLYVASVATDQPKVIVFDTSSGQKQRQISTEGFKFSLGNVDGDAIIVKDQASNIFYNIDKDGNKKQIWAYQNSTDSQEIPIAICTDDIKLLTMKVSGTDDDPKIQILSYDTDDGSLSQSFEIDFVPKTYYIFCNDDYLSLFDETGTVYIFEYSHSLPVWAIILIVVGSLLIIGGIVGFIIYKRKQSKKIGNYKQFNNEEKERNYL